ncbi:hypothetical protein F2Q68_00027669 [Brassica cretica]|uniref:Uncharacterized protein n=2 Tax=Brassica cretica TaxID=69181 RepID=A0A8S9IIE4_BRACR|nr:hypothetical protein F2Q68_00027669 [Brassica cretica]KAF3582852.1 hypothetical protein DY000_02034732 [Brassica cretica]
MLGTTSPWVGSEFNCLPRSWLALPLIVPGSLGFQDLSLFLSLFSYLVALFIAGYVSGGSPFHMYATQDVWLVSWCFGLFYSELCGSSLA